MSFSSQVSQRLLQSSTTLGLVSLLLVGSTNPPVLANPIPFNFNTVSRAETLSNLQIELNNLKARLSALQGQSSVSVSQQTTQHRGDIATSTTSGSIAQPTIPNKPTLAPSSAILVSSPSPVIVDVGQKEDYPLTLPLFQALYSANGELIAPANTPVSLTVKPHDNGALLVADSIIVNGQMISITTESLKLPGRTITRASAQDMARKNGAVVGNFLTSLAGAAGADLRVQQTIGFAGAAIGIISGLTAPDDVRVVELPANSVYILKLQ